MAGGGGGGYYGFQPQQTFAAGTSPQAIAIADLGGGYSSIIVADAGSNNISVLLNTGSYTSFTPYTYSTGSYPDGLAVGDLGNGHPDLVTANYSSGDVSVLLANGVYNGTSYQTASNYVVGTQPQGVAIANLGNGHPDIVATNGYSNTISVLLGDGSGSSFTAASYATGNNPESVVVADLGNGHPDIIVTNRNDGTITVFLGDGTGTNFTASTYTVGSSPIDVRVADLGNGHPDIVVANSGGNSVSVLLGNGTGTAFTASTVALTGGTGPSGLAIADLGNGHPDIITANANNNTVSVLLGDGTGTNYTQQTFAVGSGPRVVAVANLGNGRPDIVAGNFYDNDVSLLVAYSAAPHMFTLGGGSDSVLGDGAYDTILGTAATLGAGDSINGSSGAGTLQLTGGGSYGLNLIPAANFQSVNTISVSTGTLAAGYFDLAGGGGSVSQIIGTGIETVQVTTGGGPINLSGVTFTSIPALVLSAAGVHAGLSTTAATSALPTSVIAGGTGSAVLLVGPSMIRSGTSFDLGGNGLGELDVSGAAPTTLNLSVPSIADTRVVRNLLAAGSTSITLPSASSIVYVGGPNNDTVSAAGAAATVFGGAGSSSLVGGSGSGQVLIGGGGLDTILGGSAATTIFGSDGNYFSGASAKAITGISTGSVLIGRTNSSPSGIDTITASAGAETLFGGTANAVIANSGAGACVLVGGSGNCTLTGGSSSADTLFGGSGNATLNAGIGTPQTLVGGTGADQLTSSVYCDDVLFAGSVSNTFVISSRVYGGTAKIVNFQSGRDVIDLYDVDNSGGYIGGVHTTFGSAMVAAAVTTYANGISIQLPGASSGVQTIQILGATGFRASDFIF